jgi:hypothetical protein
VAGVQAGEPAAAQGGHTPLAEALGQAGVDGRSAMSGSTGSKGGTQAHPRCCRLALHRAQYSNRQGAHACRPCTIPFHPSPAPTPSASSCCAPLHLVRVARVLVPRLHELPPDRVELLVVAAQQVAVPLAQACTLGGWGKDVCVCVWKGGGGGAGRLWGALNLMLWVAAGSVVAFGVGWGAKGSRSQGGRQAEPAAPSAAPTPTTSSQRPAHAPPAASGWQACPPPR